MCVFMRKRLLKPIRCGLLVVFLYAMSCSSGALQSTHHLDKDKVEVFAFTDGRGIEFYDWSRITTLCVLNMQFDAQLLRVAHDHAVKVVVLVDFPSTILGNETTSDAWIDSILTQLKLVGKVSPCSVLHAFAHQLYRFPLIAASIGRR